MITLLLSPTAPLMLALAQRLAARLAWVEQDCQILLTTALPAPQMADWEIALGEFPGIAAWLTRGQRQHFQSSDGTAMLDFCAQHFPLVQPIYSQFAPDSKGVAVLPGEYWLRQPEPDTLDIQGAAPEWALTAALLQAGKRVAVAESCTGGLLAARLTEVEGVSGCFGCGLVTYGNPEKVALLGVCEQTLATFGAVSEQTVREMAMGALMHGDLAVAISGIAGPGGALPDKPVGSVCMAWASAPDQVGSQTLRFPGDRQAIRYAATSVALGQAVAMLVPFLKQT